MKMRTFVFGFQTNYDLGAAIVYATNKVSAIKMAEDCPYIWDTYNCYEITKQENPGIIRIQEDGFELIK